MTLRNLRIAAVIALALMAGTMTYRLYRTNCGATCAYGLDLRRERDLLLGVKLVSPLWSKYRADQGTVQVSGSKIQVKNDSEVLVEFSR